MVALLGLALASGVAIAREAPALRADVQCFSKAPDASASPIAAQLPAIAPRVVHWAELQSANALAAGKPLSARLARIAREAGVRRPADVRVAVVDRIPLPDEPSLQAAASKVGVVQSSAGGLTLGYAVLVVRGYENDLRLLSHELRHVAQYEACGGIPRFLDAHLGHLARFGYEAAPFEVDARAHER